MTRTRRVEIEITGEKKRSVDRVFNSADDAADRFSRRMRRKGDDAGGEFSTGLKRSLERNVTKSLGGGVARATSAAAKALAVTAASAFATQFLLVAGKALASGIAKLAHGLGAVAALIPAGALAGAAAFGTLKLAVSGVADAISEGLSGDLEKFNEALEDLSPSARRFAREVVGMRDELEGLRDVAQEQFFARFVKAVRPLAERYLPSIERTVGRIAAGFGDAVRETAEFLLLPDVSRDLDRALRNSATAVGNLTAGLANLVEGFVPLVAVGSEFLPGLSRGFEGLTERFAEWMARIARSGQLRDFIQGGLDKLGELADFFRQSGRIVGNFASGFSDLFSDANLPASHLADSLERISEQFEAWAATAAAQDRVREIFEFLREVDWGQVAQAAGALSALSLAFRGMAGLGGMVQGILALSALGPVGLIILGVAAAIAALVGAFVFAFQNSEPFRAWVQDELVPTLQDLWHWFEEKLLPVLEAVATFVRDTLAVALDELGAAIERNRPELEQVIGWIRQIVEIFGPPLLLMLGFIVVGWLGVIGVLIIVIEVIAFVVDMFNEAKDAAGDLVDFVSRHWPTLIAVISPLAMIVMGIVGVFRFLGSVASSVFGAIRGVAESVFGWIIDRIEDIRGAIRGLRNALSGVGAASGAGGGPFAGLGAIFGAQHGGVVPGRFSQAVPAVLHGSETVFNPTQQANVLMAIANGGVRRGGGTALHLGQLWASLDAGFNRVVAAVRDGADRLLPDLRKVRGFLDHIGNGIETLIRIAQIGSKNVRVFEDLASIDRRRSVPGFAAGAIVKATPGGILARIGEGRHDEAITPLPHGMGSLGGTVVYESHHYHIAGSVWSERELIATINRNQRGGTTLTERRR